MAKDILGIEVTPADWHDREIFPALLSSVEGEPHQVSADGAYDTEEAHAAHCRARSQEDVPRI